MEPFDFQSHLNSIYKSYPEAGKKPVIGITGNFADGSAMLAEPYYMAVVNAGGVPVIIPPAADTDVIINSLDNVDALLLSGGADYNPLWSGEEPVEALHGINSRRDLAELLTVNLAYNRQIPMLGICRGIQTLAMALGGKVRQDIDTTENDNAEYKTQGRIKHSQDTDHRGEPTHSVKIEPDSILFSIYKKEKIYVNSFHHQAVASCGRRFNMSACAPDGVIEAMESSEYKSILGVQWHPEWLGNDGLPLFRWLVERAAEFSEAKRIHSNIITIDSHCDTPMFFPQGIRFDWRDSRILVDLHKMTEGRQQAVTMAAYLPQPKPQQPFSEVAPFPVETPTEYADLIFDKIEDIVNKNDSVVSIARTPADLYGDMKAGRKSIMLGIENGIALGHNLQNVEHFARRGVVYITLCHNGDNDICDSARRSETTNNGVSDFGADVIREMNRQGLMVDLSHAGEKSFYDALDISQTPIVCSHSNCKALCDVPRNLTDEQMRALAQKGGVQQITLYNGFLRDDEQEASIMDAMAHLDHAVDIMGIDHVGLGTDFDGDGGVCGIADSSELINFTIQLLRRRYSLNDIEKIWGGNWLRVMTVVQETKNLK